MKVSTSAAPQSITIIDRVQSMLDDGQTDHALAFVNISGQNSPAIRNARGVCLLRLSRHEEAMRIFRDLIYPGGAIAIPHETPTIFRANFVAALLLMNDPIVANSQLDQIPDKNHPAVKQLNQTLRAWRRSLPLRRRIILLIGICPEHLPQLDYPRGWLWKP